MSMISDSESEYSGSEVEGVTVPAVHKRPARNIVLPNKLKESAIEVEPPPIDPSKLIIVQCEQTGKRHTVKINDLSKDDLEPLTKQDLQSGSSLIMQYKGRPFPVKFLQYKGSKGIKPAKRSKKIEVLLKAKDDQNGTKRTREELPDESEKVSKKSKASTDQERENLEIPHTTVLDSNDKDLLVNLTIKIDDLQNQIIKLQTVILELQTASISSASPSVSIKEEAGGDHIINGINVMRISTRDAYSFALHLLDVMFTKEELASSLMFKSKKSNKPALDGNRIQRILSFLDQRFQDKWDMKTLIAKVNQKCRDSARADFNDGKPESIGE